MTISRSDFNLVSTFLKDKSSIYKSIKNNLNQSVAFINPQVISASQKGNTINTKVQHLNSNGQYETTNYELREDSDTGNIQLVDSK